MTMIHDYLNPEFIRSVCIGCRWKFQRLLALKSTPTLRVSHLKYRILLCWWCVCCCAARKVIQKGYIIDCVGAISTWFKPIIIMFTQNSCCQERSKEGNNFSGPFFSTQFPGEHIRVILISTFLIRLVEPTWLWYSFPEVRIRNDAEIGLDIILKTLFGMFPSCSPWFNAMISELFCFRSTTFPSRLGKFDNDFYF